MFRNVVCKLYDIFTRKDKLSNGACESVEEINVNETEASDNIRNENSEIKAESIAINGIITQIKVKDEIIETSVPKSENLPSCDWMVGDLAWARVSGYPFWPCMIALDPEKGIFTRIISKFNFYFVHVINYFWFTN